jgi:hypothetical protein
MAIPRSVLMVELLMSADRVITAAREAGPPASAQDWPPATVVGHLSQVDQQVWLPRLEQMVSSQVVPEFTWWEPDAESTREAFAQATLDEAGAGLLASRTRLLHRLRELDDAGWAATGQHDVFGALDVEGLMVLLLAHDEEHRASLLLGNGGLFEAEVSE